MSLKKKKPNPSSKIKIRGKDNAALTCTDLGQGLIETAQRLKKDYPQYRAKWATVFIELVDEDGKTVWLKADPGLEKATWEIYPYKTAAADHGL